jgi:hypothetical protein
VLHVLTSDFDVGPVSIVPAFTGSLGFDPVEHFASCFPKHLFKQEIISMSEEHRYSEAAESDDELPLTQCTAVKVTKRPATAVLTSQAKPRFVKWHMSRTSANQSKQSTRRDLLMVLGKQPSQTAKVGGRGSARRMVHSSSPELFGRC